MVVLKSLPGFYFWNRDLFLPNAPTCRLTPGSFQRLGSRQVWRSKSHSTQDRVLASTWDRRARPCPSHPWGPHKLLQAQCPSGLLKEGWASGVPGRVNSTQRSFAMGEVVTPAWLQIANALDLQHQKWPSPTTSPSKPPQSPTRLHPGSTQVVPLHDKLLTHWFLNVKISVLP